MRSTRMTRGVQSPPLGQAADQTLALWLGSDLFETPSRRQLLCLFATAFLGLTVVAKVGGTGRDAEVGYR